MKPWYHNDLYKKIVAIVIVTGMALAFFYWLFEQLFK
mgnify:CR=1 FL=1